MLLRLHYINIAYIYRSNKYITIISTEKKSHMSTMFVLSKRNCHMRLLFQLTVDVY